jgi:hypothetical protein
VDGLRLSFLNQWVELITRILLGINNNQSRSVEHMHLQGDKDLITCKIDR